MPAGKFTEVRPGIFRWTDTCNVYVVRDGTSAILIDLGDGSVLDALATIGVKQIDWVLFTHHHREQCQGGAKLAAWRERGTKVASSAIERPFFEKPESFRRMRPTLSDPFTVYGTSFVRPPVAPIAIDRAFAKMDDLEWRGREFWCIETGGNSPGHTTYLLKTGGEWLAFSGDLMCDGAKLHTWFDTEWDYGFAAGIYELAKSAAQVAGYEPALLLPAHGPQIADPSKQLTMYVQKLKHLASLYLRGYDCKTFDNCDQDNSSRPSPVPHLWQITKHLYKFRGPNYWVNFAMLLADSGHALFIDCGLFDRNFLDQAIARMQERLGLKKIDAIFVTHMHGDHALDAEYVRKKYGSELWTMEGVADKFERPWDFDLSALLPFYTDRGKEVGPLVFDRVVRDGETIDWEGYSLTVDWMPGQTKYHACLHGTIDERRVAFTGDNIFASTTDPRQGGNECVLARNGGTLEEGYLYAAEYLHTINPDLIIGGHCWLLDRPEQLIERYRARMRALREAFEDLSVEDDYRFMFDPYWVKAAPYRVVVEPGRGSRFHVVVRNYLTRPLKYRVTLNCPAGLSAKPAVIDETIDADATVAFPVMLNAAADAKPGLHMVSFDITRGGIRHGELFDFIAHVGALDPTLDVFKPSEKKADY
jgi:glyoxylase-like metal-dependent hydrolase (beta-lactamase superfamily II)